MGKSIAQMSAQPLSACGVGPILGIGDDYKGCINLANGRMICASVTDGLSQEWLYISLQKF